MVVELGKEHPIEGELDCGDGKAKFSKALGRFAPQARHWSRLRDITRVVVEPDRNSFAKFGIAQQAVGFDLPDVVDEFFVAHRNLVRHLSSSIFL